MVWQAQKATKSFKNLFIGISVFVILFSVINLINTVITSMVTRKKNCYFTINGNDKKTSEQNDCF